MRDCERICRYLHVPAQHGSDRVLKAMNRGYTIGEYRDFVDRARAYMPDVSLVSDFIVGFPTETEEEFQSCKDVVRHARFKNSFIFKYSPRPGTIAINRFTDDVPEEVKKRRNQELLAVQNEMTAQNNLELVGQTLEVMVEGESKLVSRQADRQSAYPKSNVTLGAGFDRLTRVSGPDHPQQTQLVGRTRGDQIVVFDGTVDLKGKLIDVEITRAKSLTLFGTRAAAPAVA
jgi:tRNA-2-methylthio-N6-dimethylallyladenosine synthase